MTTTSKILSDTSLELKFVTNSDFGSAPRAISNSVRLTDLLWYATFSRANPGQFGIYVDCYANCSNIWKADAKFTCKLLKNDNTYLSKTGELVFTYNSYSWGWRSFVPLEELENYVIDGKLTLEVHIEVRSITGLHKVVRHNFEEKDEKLSDVVLVVEDKKLHVGKMVLACASPVFKSMFYSDFKESKAAEIPILDVKFVEFEQFLQLIYNYHIHIDKFNAPNLLKLADRFDVPPVARKCEQYLITSKSVSINYKLKIADEFKLSFLHSTCLEAITNMADLKKFVPNIEEMGEATAKALYKKSIDFSKTN